MSNIISKFKNIVITTIAVSLFATNAIGQEYFQLTQFIYSAHAINPALSGIEDLVNANIGMRTQWTSIAESPTTFYFGFNGSLSGMKSAFTKQRTLRTSVPRLYNKLQNCRARKGCPPLNVLIAAKLSSL